MNSTPRSDPSWTPRSRVQRRNERGETLLHTAAIKGDLKAATALIEQGAEVNATDNAGEDWEGGTFSAVPLKMFTPLDDAKCRVDSSS